jgi:hypothetical protein
MRHYEARKVVARRVEFVMETLANWVDVEKMAAQLHKEAEKYGKPFSDDLVKVRAEDGFVVLSFVVEVNE